MNNQPPKYRSGMSLIEVVASTMIVGMMAVATLNALGAATKSSNSIGNRAIALGLADELMSEIMQQPYSDPDGSNTFGHESGEATSPRSAFDDVDDYNGWNVSPPQYRDGTVIPNRTGWTQHVAGDAGLAHESDPSGRHRPRRQTNSRLHRLPRSNPRRPIGPSHQYRHELIMNAHHKSRRRSGGIYIAVLGTALVVSLLGMSAMIGQRLQNRMVSTSGDVRQAQLNANTAIELGLLAMKSDTNWRTTYSNGNVFANRATNAGTCTLTVRNIPDPGTPLSTNADDPIILLGVGNSGEAVQRAKVTIDPRKDPLSCLRYAVATGGAITLQSDTLRTGGVISANTVSATSSQVYGKVEATSATGSTYNSGTTTVTAAKRPTMPDWTSVFSYYRTNGTQIDINSLPTQTPNLG